MEFDGSGVTGECGGHRDTADWLIKSMAFQTSLLASHSAKTHFAGSVRRTASQWGLTSEDIAELEYHHHSQLPANQRTIISRMAEGGTKRHVR